MINNNMDLILIFLSAFLINNILLIRFIGLCSFFGLSASIKNSFGMGVAVTFVTMMAAAVSWLIYYRMLIPLHIGFLRTAAFILTIASLVQLEEMFLKRYMPPLYRAMGIYLPLITTNCAILAVTFLNIDYGLSFIKSMIYAFGVALGYTLAIIIMATLRERILYSSIPKALQGYPIVFFVASLMSLAF